MSARENPASASLIARWQERRPWTRTDTTRWLDARPDAVKLWLLIKRNIALRKRVQLPGSWIYVNRKVDFAAAHTALAELGSDLDRDSARMMEVLPP